VLTNLGDLFDKVQGVGILLRPTAEIEASLVLDVFGRKAWLSQQVTNVWILTALEGRILSLPPLSRKCLRLHCP
jgi:hypothetical protein